MMHSEGNRCRIETKESHIRLSLFVFLASVVYFNAKNVFTALQ